MKDTMELDTKKIIDLHKIDLRLQEIEEEKGDLPSIISDQKNGIAGFNKKVDSCNSEIDELNKLKSSYNTSLSDFSVKMDKYNKQMDSVRNNKEYDALLVEIDHLKSENGELTNKIEDVDKKVDELKSCIDDCSEKIGDLTEKLANNEKELQDKSTEFSVEEKLLLKDKNSLLSNIVDKDFIESYENDERELVAPVYNGSCSSCYTSLPAQTLVDIRKGLSLVRCPSCSIFLYSDE